MLFLQGLNKFLNVSISHSEDYIRGFWARYTLIIMRNHQNRIGNY